jgi:hypothetical protein
MPSLPSTEKDTKGMALRSVTHVRQLSAKAAMYAWNIGPSILTATALQFGPEQGL